MFSVGIKMECVCVCVCVCKCVCTYACMYSCVCAWVRVCARAGMEEDESFCTEHNVT